MPHWLFAVFRVVWWPATWGRRRLRRRYADRQALDPRGREHRDQGAAVCGEPRTDLDDEHRAYLQDRHATWHKELRGPLRTFANLHPSDEVREQGRELESAVGADLSATIYLLSTRKSREAHNAFPESDRAHKAAVAKSEALMNAIRRLGDHPNTVLRTYARLLPHSDAEAAQRAAALLV